MTREAVLPRSINTTHDFSDSVSVPAFNDLIVFPTSDVFLNSDAMGEDAADDQTALD